MPLMPKTVDNDGAAKKLQIEKPMDVIWQQRVLERMAEQHRSGVPCAGGADIILPDHQAPWRGYTGKSRAHAEAGTQQRQDPAAAHQSRCWGECRALTENSSISSRPNHRRPGSRIQSAQPRGTSSKNVFCLTASKIPSGMAIRYVRTKRAEGQNTCGGQADSDHLGNRLLGRIGTGSDCLSPARVVHTEPEQAGSRPFSWLKASICSGFAFMPSARRAGSPGLRLSIRKTMIDTP